MNSTDASQLQTRILSTPDRSEAWVKLIKFYIDQNSLAKASIITDAMQAAGINSPWGKAFLGHIELKRGRPNKCLEILERISTKEIDHDLQSWIDEWRIEALIDLGDIESAKRIVKDKNHPLPSPVRSKEIEQRIDDYIASTPRNNLRASECNPTVIAFYLPQFHPFLENDTWWGPGFTEWTNICDSKAYFPLHCQPRRPSSLGFYDLRLAETQRKQADLATKYGINAFCHYFYWFSGKELMHEPLKVFLEDPSIDIQFCLCWANETWSRRWDGSESDILIEQLYHDEDPKKFANRLANFFEDSRYVRLDSSPLFLVYRPNQIPNINKVIRGWRHEFSVIGYEKVHIVACLTFGYTADQASGDGFDSSTEFHPHNSVATELNKEDYSAKKFEGKLYSYKEVVQNSVKLLTLRNLQTTHPCTMLGWDNTPRRGSKGNVFIDFDYNYFGAWLIVNRLKVRLANPGSQLIFINAWNEWCEGTYLEPDRDNGFESLEVTYSNVRRSDNIPAILTALKLCAPFFDSIRNSLSLEAAQAIEKFTVYARNCISTEAGNSQRLFIPSHDALATYYYETESVIACAENYMSNFSKPVNEISGWIAGVGEAPHYASVRVGTVDSYCELEFSRKISYTTQREDVMKYHLEQGRSISFAKSWHVSIRDIDVAPNHIIQAIIFYDESGLDIARLNTYLTPHEQIYQEVTPHEQAEIAIRDLSLYTKVFAQSSSLTWRNLGRSERSSLFDAYSRALDAYNLVVISMS